jgi:hypothetical protein
VEYGGFGTASVETTVELKARTGPKRTIQILGFTDDGASMGLKMNWITPSHLEVLFKGDPNILYYQVVKTSGVEISVRDLSDPQNRS